MKNELIEAYIKRLITESTPEKPLWNVEILQGRKPSWNYIDGCMLSALIALFQIRKNQQDLDFILSYTDSFIEEDGTIPTLKIEEYSLDDLSESRILFDLYDLTGKEKYLKAIHYSYQQLLKQPRTFEGNFWHKPRHPHQVWLDGLFMGQVFYMRYETKINHQKNYADIRHQYELVRKHLYNPQTGLYYHGYDSSKTAFWCDKETGLSKGYWLRACGWYLMSLVEILSDMDSKHEDALFYKQLLSEAVEGILPYQDTETKLFYNVPNYPKREGNYLETSGSSMIAYTLLKGSRIGVLDKKYHAIGKEIFEGICQKYLSVKNGNLNLGGICLMAGLGNALFRDGSYEYYISEPVVENDAKGVGPFLLAYIETLRKN